MEDFARTDHWLQTSLQRLTADGFTIRNQNYFKVVAHRSRVELTKFGNVETYYIFADFDYLDAHLMRRFSLDAYTYAEQTKVSPLPNGLFESVWCFAVAIARNIEGTTPQVIKTEAPLSHMSGGELRIAYDVPRHQLYYYEKTPLWGGAYYSGFRKQILRYLC
jgi:hypothetical protein